MQQITARPNESGSRRSLQRVAGVDAIVARELLTQAIQILEPDGRSQRQLFAALMPELFVLRNKGCSFAQLTSLLNHCGINLQPGTVRVYYSEMLSAKMELCQSRMHEQLVVLAKVQEITRGPEITAIASKVLALKEKQRATVEAKVNAVFAQIAPAPAPRDTETTKATRPESREKAAPPSAAVETPVAQAEGEFGLLAPTHSAEKPVSVRPGAGFFSMADDAPQVPDVGSLDAARLAARHAPGAVASSVTSNQHCAKLQPGIEPMEQRAGVPEAVYEEGALEHPAVPGLMLSRDERLYGALLEIVDEDGVLRKETLDEKRFRVKWKRPVPAAETESRKRFVPMHADSFGGGGKPSE